MQKPKKENKTVSLLVRFAPAELETAREQARAAGIPLSVFVRSAVAGAKIRTHADAEILAELRRQGGLCKHLYNRGAPADATRSALLALEDIAARLIRD